MDRDTKKQGAKRPGHSSLVRPNHDSHEDNSPPPRHQYPDPTQYTTVAQDNNFLPRDTTTISQSRYQVSTTQWQSFPRQQNNGPPQYVESYLDYLNEEISFADQDGQQMAPQFPNAGHLQMPGQDQYQGPSLPTPVLGQDQDPAMEGAGQTPHINVQDRGGLPYGAGPNFTWNHHPSGTTASGAQWILPPTQRDSRQQQHLQTYQSNIGTGSFDPNASPWAPPVDYPRSAPYGETVRQPLHESTNNAGDNGMPGAGGSSSGQLNNSNCPPIDSLTAQAADDDTSPHFSSANGTITYVTTNNEILFESEEERASFIRRQARLRRERGINASFIATRRQGTAEDQVLREVKESERQAVVNDDKGPRGKKRKRGSAKSDKKPERARNGNKTAMPQFKGFPSGEEHIPHPNLAKDGFPRGMSLYGICQRYPNHLNGEYLQPFLQRNWSAKEIFESMDEDARQEVFERARGKSDGNAPEMFMVKRRSAQEKILRGKQEETKTKPVTWQDRNAKKKEWNALIGPTIGSNPTYWRDDGRPIYFTRHSSAKRRWTAEDLEEMLTGPEPDESNKVQKDEPKSKSTGKAVKAAKKSKLVTRAKPVKVEVSDDEDEDDDVGEDGDSDDREDEDWR